MVPSPTQVADRFGLGTLAPDAAMWWLWNPNHTVLLGLIISHVDDLLMGGNEEAKKSLDKLGEELTFGSIATGKFTYYDKLIEKKPNGDVCISMRECHENLKPVEIPLARRKDPEAALTPAEFKQCRAVLGSLQWLVANCRFDMGFQLSVLQGERRVVGTLLRANHVQLSRRFKEHSNFELRFKPMDCGIMVVSDASLGNGTRDGGTDAEPVRKVYSQAAHFVLLASADLMAGRKGGFMVLDARSHRLQRVCRSTFSAELLGVEEAVDVGHYCRGYLASAAPWLRSTWISTWRLCPSQW